MDKLYLEHIEKCYDDWSLSLDLHVEPGEIMTLLGPSGCGKTTTLRIIAGFIHADAGHLHLDEKIIDDVPPYQRNIGVVFQDYALFPHMNVFKNIAFGIRMKRQYSKLAIRERVEELLALVGLEGYEHRYPEQLSGGEQQRIALLRSIAPHPDILLLDEPLSALDFQLRKRLRQEIKNVQRRLGITTIYVTHDQEEAMSISDKITVMKDGRVQQIGSPVDIYQHPKTDYVAQFVGMSNVVDGIIREHIRGHFLVESSSYTFTIPARKGYSVQDRVTFFFRPEESFLSVQPASKNTIGGTIVEHEYLGAEILTTVSTRNQQLYIVSNYIKDDAFIGRETTPVYINFPVEACKIVERV
ncbi:ABC transporter ATP-binding protein [candidate division KSB3 bacterium]|uniref:ABC transporter ATP-binding protein n=1 Tax=candidate division KSB3 bacterium TaxID=2044937 RepID=A0A2G6KGP1_9BACT|nr:MAG: ABC transporter ATP-binding protein [candidate division KSB3 bacterium]